MALYDEPGTATFPACSKFGHFVFLRISGEKKDKYLALAEIEKCPVAQVKTGWKAHLRKLKKEQIERKVPPDDEPGYYNPQMSFPIDEVPAIIAALAKTYESITLKTAPPEGQAYVKQYAETESDREAAGFVHTSSEFGGEKF